MIIETKIDTYMQRFFCDECTYEVILKEPTLMPFLTIPPKFPHSCTNESCKKEYILEWSYPRIIHKEYNEESK